MRHEVNKIVCVLVAFCMMLCGIPRPAGAEDYRPNLLLPTTNYNPPVIKGIKLCEDPYRFDFIFANGDAKLTPDQVRQEARRMIEFFIAALAVPNRELWVNLKPNEPDRIVPTGLGKTQLGLEMLDQDYLLKAMSASLTYPALDTGKKYWAAALKQDKVGYNNRIWIVPGKASVYANKDRVYIGEATLQVKSEQEYRGIFVPNGDMMRNTVIPTIQKEVDHGKTFTRVRQLYRMIILASWFKKHLQDAALVNRFADSNKVMGSVVPGARETVWKIFSAYCSSFSDGTYSVKKREGKYTMHYFSGGMRLGMKVLGHKPGTPISSTNDGSPWGMTVTAPKPAPVVNNNRDGVDMSQSLNPETYVLSHATRSVTDYDYIIETKMQSVHVGDAAQVFGQDGALRATEPGGLDYSHISAQETGSLDVKQDVINADDIRGIRPIILKVTPRIK